MRLRRVFNVFLENQVSVDVVATSEISVSLTLDPGCAPAASPLRISMHARDVRPGCMPKQHWQEAH